MPHKASRLVKSFKKWAPRSTTLKRLCRNAKMIKWTEALLNPSTASFRSTIANLKMTKVTSYSVCKLIPLGERDHYGLTGVKILASSNTDVLKVPEPIDMVTLIRGRRTGVLEESDFTECWNQALGNKMVDEVFGTFEILGLGGKLVILRIGFNQNRQENPITVQVMITEWGVQFPSDAEILSFLESLNQILHDHWTGVERVYIDICKFTPHTNTSESLNGIDQCPWGQLASFYQRDLPPFLGSSIGTDHEAKVGTLTAYVKHTVRDPTNDSVISTPFALTCNHAIAQSVNVNASELRILSPSRIDTAQTCQKLQNLLGNLVNADERVEIQNTLQTVRNYDPVIGVAYAAGGECCSYQDWALIRLHREFSEEEMSKLNQHRPWRRFEMGSGFDMGEQDGFDIKFITNAESHYFKGPILKTTRREPLKIGDYCLKPPSRSTRIWGGCRVSALPAWLRTKVTLDKIKVTYCLIGTADTGGPLTVRGDSGTLILDRDGHPVGMSWGGLDGDPSVTAASKIEDIFKDIEEQMGWETGSVSFC